MAQVITTNTMSLVAQNNLTKSQSALGTAIERLSSGLRINSAKDDAAGQAIANRFTANIRGLTQAARNANDGISIAQTTEGALNEINNNVQRIRELTVQATTGSNSADDLKSIQDEIGQRLAEINRVSEQTDFNGKKVLSSTAGSLTIQVGANDNETITINLKEISAKTLGLDKFDVTKLATNTTLGASGSDKVLKGTDSAFISYLKTTATGTGADAAPETAKITGLGTDESIVSYTDTDGKTQYAVKTPGATSADPATFTKIASVAYTAGTESFAITKEGSALDSDAITQSPLATLDKALSDIDSLRGELGAVQNRFESTVTNLNNTINNLSAARSRIQDADYATEVSNMSTNQILQQAGTSVLAQANQVPQTVLSLLQ